MSRATKTAARACAACGFRPRAKRVERVGEYNPVTGRLDVSFRLVEGETCEACANERGGS